mgnify:CR=1 FL=1
MVVLQIQISHGAIDDAKGDSPIARNAHARRTQPIAGQLVNAPTRRALEAVHLPGNQVSGENSTNSINEIPTKAAWVVVLLPVAAIRDA